MARPPTFPPGHPLASKYIQTKYGTDLPDPGTVDLSPVVFQAYVSPSGMKILPASQAMEIPLIVVGHHIDSALPLRALAGTPMPLMVEITVWPDAAAQISENARELEEKYGSG